MTRQKWVVALTVAFILLALTPPTYAQQEKPLAIDTSVLPDGIVGKPYSDLYIGNNGVFNFLYERTPDVTMYAIEGSKIGYVWDAKGLPPGIEFDRATGKLHGVPTKNGNFDVAFQVSDSKGATTSKSIRIKINPETFTGDILYIDVPNDLEDPPNGMVSVPYDFTFKVVGGVKRTAYTWGLDHGELPPGLTFANGNLSGTPTKKGTYSFGIYVKDDAGSIGKKHVRFGGALEITEAVGVVITTAKLPDAILSSPYSQTIAAVGGTTPYLWNITAGDLPPGLSISPDGTISGTPTELGSYMFTVTVVDSTAEPSALTDSETYTIEVKSTTTIPNTGGPIHLNSLPDGTVNEYYAHKLEVTGGVSPFFFFLVDGELPPGLKLGETTGRISGTPTISGIYNFTIRVGDSSGNLDLKNFSIKIFPTTDMIDIRGRTVHLSFMWNVSRSWASFAILSNMSDTDSQARITAVSLSGWPIGQQRIVSLGKASKVIVPCDAAFFGDTLASGEPFSVTVESTTSNLFVLGALVNTAPESENDFVLIDPVPNGAKANTIVAPYVSTAHPYNTYIVLQNLEFAPMEVLGIGYDGSGNELKRDIFVIPSQGLAVQPGSNWIGQSSNGWVKFRTQTKCLTGKVFYVNNAEARYVWQIAPMMRRLIAYANTSNSFPTLNFQDSLSLTLGKEETFKISAVDKDDESALTFSGEVKPDPRIDINRISITFIPATAINTDLNGGARAEIKLKAEEDVAYTDTEWEDPVEHEKLEKQRLAGKTVYLKIRVTDNVGNFDEKTVTVKFNQSPTIPYMIALAPDPKTGVYVNTQETMPEDGFIGWELTRGSDPRDAFLSHAIEFKPIDRDGDVVKFRFLETLDYTGKIVSYQDIGFSLKGNVLGFVAPSVDTGSYECFLEAYDGRGGSFIINVLYIVKNAQDTTTQ